MPDPIDPTGLEPGPPHDAPPAGRSPGQFEPALGELAEALHEAGADRARPRRVRAIIKLGRHRDPRSLPALLAAAEDADWVMRKYALGALGILGAGAGREVARRALGDAHHEVRRAAARALKRLDDGRALTDWLCAVRDPDWQVRSAALEALAAYPPEAACPAWRAALEDAVWVNRYLALQALAPRLDPPADPEVMAACLARLRHDAPLAPWLGMALARAGSAALGGLVALLAEAPPWRRLAIAKALGRIDAPEARTALATLFGHPDPEVEDAVRRQGPAMREALVAALGGADWVVRWHASLLLGQLGDPAAVPALVAHLDDARPEVRLAVLEAMGRLGDPGTLEALLGVLADPSWRVRRAAVLAVAVIDAPRAREALIAMLADRHAEVREGARAALQRLGPHARAALEAALLVRPGLYDEIAWLLRPLR